MSAPQSA
ncbi:hypothetical protein VCHC62B1_1932A, partial [Vibrio cholerae HC-62B1]